MNDFDILHAAVCAHLKVPEQASAAEEGPVRSFRLQVEGVEACVMHVPAVDARHVFVLIDFGKPTRDELVKACQLALDANHALLTEPRGAAFSRNPFTGQFLLQYTCALDGTSAQELVGSVAAMAGIVLRGGLTPQESHRMPEVIA